MSMVTNLDGFIHAKGHKFRCISSAYPYMVYGLQVL